MVSRYAPHSIVLAFAGLAVLALVPTAAADAFLDDGNVALGVASNGAIGVAAAPAGAAGQTWAGVRDATGAEGLAHHYRGAPCGSSTCEGWSLTLDGSQRAIGLPAMYGPEPISYGLTDLAFTSTATTATATSRLGAVEVRHDFAPAARAAGLYEAEVRLRNVGADTVGDVAYERLVPFSPGPGTLMTLGSDHAPRELVRSCSATGLIGEAVALGPCHGDEGFPATSGFADRAGDGAAILLHGGALEPGEHWSFSLFYGAAPSETDALRLVRTVGAQWWALAQDGTGTGATWVFAFRAGNHPAEPCSGPAPSPVSDLRVERSGAGIDLTWTPPSADACPALRLVLERTGPGYDPVTYLAPGTSHHEPAPACGVYEYSLRAVNWAGSSAGSSATLDTRAAPQAPYVSAWDGSDGVTFLVYGTNVGCRAERFELYRDGVLVDSAVVEPCAEGRYCPPGYSYLRDQDAPTCREATYEVRAVNAQGYTASTVKVTHGMWVTSPTGQRVQVPCAPQV